MGPNVAANKDDVPHTLTHDRPRRVLFKTSPRSRRCKYSVYCIEQFSPVCHTQAGRCVVAHDVTLERRIRELCSQAVAAKDADTLRPIMGELRDALREHNKELQRILTEYPFLLDDIVKPAA